MAVHVRSLRNLAVVKEIYCRFYMLLYFLQRITQPGVLAALEAYEPDKSLSETVPRCSLALDSLC